MIKVSLEIGREDRSFLVQPSGSFEEFLQAFLAAVVERDVKSCLTSMRRNMDQFMQLRNRLELN